jgi:hypothetical protein
VNADTAMTTPASCGTLGADEKFGFFGVGVRPSWSARWDISGGMRILWFVPFAAARRRSWLALCPDDNELSLAC